MKMMKTRIALALCAAMLSLAWVSDLHAQAQQAAVAWLTRSMLTTSFRNLANQDAYFKSAAGNTSYMTYPNNLPRGGSYGSVRIGSDAYAFSVRGGHGVWTMTSDQRVVYSGARISMVNQHIKAMQYDVSADPDLSKLGRQWYQQRRPRATLGFGQRSATGVEESSLGGNWWPGAPLIEDGKKSQPLAREPVHIMNFNLGAYAPNDAWPEEIIITKGTNSQGLTITERALAWSHPDFDDFFIDEYIIENTGDTDGDGNRDLPAVAQNDLYVGFQDRFNNSAAGQSAYQVYWYDDNDWGTDDWYKYDAGTKLLYNYDGNHPIYASWDDTGDPYFDAFAWGTDTRGGKVGQGEGTLMSPAHAGVGVVAYTNDLASPYAFNPRDRNQGYVAPAGDQPYAVRYWEWFGQKGFLTTTGHKPTTLSAGRQEPHVGVMTEKEMHAEVLGPGRLIEPNPLQPSSQFSMLVFGPYNLPPGGRAKIVLAYVAGQPGQVLGNTDTWTWARKGNQSELPKGLDAIQQNIAAARFAYANTYDIPDAPPDVNFRTGSSPTANMQLEWSADVEKAAHPDYIGTEANDIAGFRVYRSTWFGDGPWELIGDIPVGGTTRETATYRASRNGNDYLFEDLRSTAGFFYHYSVRAYAKGHQGWSPGNPNSPLAMERLPAHIVPHVQAGQEGGWAAWTQRTYADESPFAVPSAASEALDRRVTVVPNPYFADAAHAYPGSTKIRFVGIPSRCRIRVFSVSGDLVSDFSHNDPSKGEADYNQITWVNNGEIATGVYFWVVENLIPGSNQGKLQKGALMVIR